MKSSGVDMYLFLKDIDLDLIQQNRHRSRFYSTNHYSYISFKKFQKCNPLK